MRLPITCMYCVKEKVPITSINDIMVNVEVNDNGRYKTTCKNGHESITILQQQKFEVLFEIGAYAVIDGYYREAVSSFTSALERFYECFIKTVCFSKGIELPVITSVWKKVSNQSERQLGAFIFTYLNEFGVEPDLLPDKYIKFRNAVIHKGKIPAKVEAVEYGQVILDLIRPILIQTQEKYEHIFDEEFIEKSTRSPGDGNLPISTMFIPMILGSTAEEDGCHEGSLSTIIEKLKYYKPI